MKWVALVVFIVAIPLIAAWLKTNPRQAPWLWGMLTFTPFVMGPLHLEIAPWATPMWAGFVKGWEVSFLDSIALGIILGTRGRWPKLIIVGPFLAYFVANCLALLQARFPNLAFSYIVQLVRVFLVLLAAARIAQTEQGERALLTGLIAGLVVQAGFALWERFNGVLQTGGTLGHQNMLGMVTHMILMPSLAMLLAGRYPKRAFVGVLLGLLVVALTASRATITFAALGLFLTMVFSLSARFTGRKAAVAVAALMLLAISAPLVKSALDRRFEKQNITFMTADDQRLAFERAARAMLAANPLGVGPNHYVFISITEGYAERANVAWSENNRSAHVHNVYLLVGAETGYAGVITLTILLLSTIFYAFNTGFKYRHIPGAETLIGVGTALVAVCLHGLLEWIFVLAPAQYVFAGLAGLIIGMRSRYTRQAQAQSKRRSSGPTPLGLQPQLSLGRSAP